MANNDMEIRDSRNTGWFWIDTRVLKEHGADLGPHALAIYMALAAHADNNTSKCFPGVSTLAESAGMSTRQARKALRKLEEIGLIHTQTRPGRSSVYTLLSVSSDGQGAPRPSAGDPDTPARGAAPPAQHADPPRHDMPTNYTHSNYPHSTREGARGAANRKKPDPSVTEVPSVRVFCNAVTDAGGDPTDYDLDIIANAQITDLQLWNQVVRTDLSDSGGRCPSLGFLVETIYPRAVRRRRRRGQQKQRPDRDAQRSGREPSLSYGQMLEVFQRLGGNARMSDHFERVGKEWRPVTQAAIQAMKRGVTGSLL
jgi:DNA-binding MarR family transcriptional regulator